MTTSEPTILLPGDPVDPSALLPTHHSKKPLRIGPGLQHMPPNDIVSTVSGRPLSDRRKNMLWLEYNSRRYTPSPSDPVLVQIHHSTPDSLLVHLSPHTPLAHLPLSAFENASKKNRPQLPPGSLVYARVSQASRHTETELECVSATTGRAEGLGPLPATKASMVVDVSLGMARRLLMMDAEGEGGVVVLECVGKAGVGGFETAVGRNGRVWVGSDSRGVVMVVVRALRETDERGLGVEEQRKLVRRLVGEVFKKVGV